MGLIAARAKHSTLSPTASEHGFIINQQNRGAGAIWAKKKILEKSFQQFPSSTDQETSRLTGGGLRFFSKISAQSQRGFRQRTARAV